MGVFLLTMDELRKLHNKCKRDHISCWVPQKSHVLDCGCGRGGDWHKWKAVNARVTAIDPDTTSLKEAETRALEMKFGVWFLGQGDIRQAAFAGPYDVVSYNFSLQYIFEDSKTFEDSIRAIGVAVKPGGLLIGIAPEKARAEAMVDRFGHFKDRLGNEFGFVRGSTRLLVNLVGGPFYEDGGREEPILDANVLVRALNEVGFDLVQWEPMIDRPNGLISDLYSKFVFKKRT
jgi:mRNA capping enzyme